MRRHLELLTAVVTVALAAPTASLAALPYVESTVEDGGSLRGQVRFTGTRPAPQSMAINQDMEICGSAHRLHQSVKVEAGGLGDVVVVVEGVEKGKAWDGDLAVSRLRQEKCAFVPYLQVVKKRGGQLEVTNADNVSHNIHTYELIGRVRVSMFNIQQPANSSFSKKIKMRRGSVIRMECDQHEFMVGWAYAVDNPYYALVSRDGTFSISDLPAGQYELKAWHPYLGVREASVTVEAGVATRVDFEFE